MLTQVRKPWPRNAWYQAAWAHEVKDAPLARTILNEPVVLFRDAQGKARALEDRCCHRGTPLRLGEVVPLGLQCGYHGMVFDGEGKCVKIPGQDAIPPQAKVKSYPIVERQNFVWIWMGEAPADASKIVDYPWIDDRENCPHSFGMNYVKCNFMLLMDNLMDLTHIPHIHRKTIGGGQVMEQVNARMDVKRTDRGVHYIRWMIGITPPPTYVKAARFPDGLKVDRWQEFEYVAPCSVIQWTGALPTGQGAEKNRDQKGGFSLRLYHGATPETETSCFYFWSPGNGCDVRDEASNQKLHTEIANTFLEDVAVLEAQQQNLSADPERLLIDLKHDIARLPARRALDRMIREEISQA